MRKLAQIAIISFAAIAAAQTATAQQFTVEAHKTKQLKLRGQAATIVIGDPRVADIAVHDENLIFVTGRTFGTTNLLIYNADGKSIFNGDVVVTTNSSNFLSINRAGETNSYDCTPRCRSIVSIGDDQAYFDNVVSQTRQVQNIAEQTN